MSETAVIETINVEQIATVTDLLLLRARTTSRRLSNNKLAFVRDRRVNGRPSVSMPIIPAPATKTFHDAELTLFVRARKIGASTASAAVVATVFAVAIVLTSLL